MIDGIIGPTSENNPDDEKLDPDHVQIVIFSFIGSLGVHGLGNRT